MYYARVPFPGNLLLNQRKEFYVEREQIELTDFPRQSSLRQPVVVVIDVFMLKHVIDIILMLNHLWQCEQMKIGTLRAIKNSVDKVGNLRHTCGVEDRSNEICVPQQHR